VSHQIPSKDSSEEEDKREEKWQQMKEEKKKRLGNKKMLPIFYHRTIKNLEEFVEETNAGQVAVFFCGLSCISQYSRFFSSSSPHRDFTKASKAQSFGKGIYGQEEQPEHHNVEETHDQNTFAFFFKAI